MLKHINSIEYFYFQIGGYFEGNRQIIIKDNYFELMKSQYGFSENILSKENHLTINSISSLIEVLNDISLLSWDENYSNEDVMDGTQWEIEIKYNGYIEREKQVAKKIKRLEEIKIPEKLCYENINAISTEAKQKLNKIKPKTIGQATRISGVSPSDINILLLHLGR